ncbi:MAG: sodium:proton antiporter [Planctomycetota bacterium]|nr:sodium:proton antiporter [Planctomycetota bacterium]
MSDEHGHGPSGFQGPKCWVATALVGFVLGTILAFVLPKPAAIPLATLAGMKGKTVEEMQADYEKKLEAYEKALKEHGREAGQHVAPPVNPNLISPPDIRPWHAIPFALLLLSIALMPFINLHFWEHHFPDFAFFLGGIMVAYYIFALSGYTTSQGQPEYGIHKMVHVGLEYFQFIALVGSLYVVTGGILIDIKGHGKPALNTLILAIGAAIANVIGTTGAAALLIRAYIRINKHRIQAFHVVIFIFIVANCGGCLTPIGDPPLFLGYLQGVPFSWTLIHCLPAWAFAVTLLLAVFYVMDVKSLKAYEQGLPEEERGAEAAKNAVSVSGYLNLVFLALVLLGVFLDGILHHLGVHIHFPFGAILQIVSATLAYKLSKPENLKANEFTFGPIKEVGFLFIGLFATMVPALDYLGNNAASLGIETPGAFYWAAGALSSFLDNAPTYLNFLSAGHGLAGMEMGKALDTPAWIQLTNVHTTGYSAQQILLAISLASVFFGANTYIGNAPNFMVKAISESSGVPMPSFFGYILRFAVPILMPILIIVWIVFTSGWVL